MPAKTDTMKTLQTLFRRVNFALPQAVWAADCQRIQVAIKQLFAEEGVTLEEEA